MPLLRGVVGVAVLAAALAVSCLHRAGCSRGDAPCLVSCCDFPRLLSAGAREKSECGFSRGPVCRRNVVTFDIDFFKFFFPFFRERGLLSFSRLFARDRSLQRQ